MLFLFGECVGDVVDLCLFEDEEFENCIDKFCDFVCDMFVSV